MNGGQQPSLKVSQILVLALLGGLVLFTAVVIGLRLTGRMPPTQPPIAGQPDVLLLALIGLCVVQTPIFFLVPSMMVKGLAAKWQAATSDEARESIVLGGLQIVSIVRGALVEGAGLLGTTIYLIQGEPLALVAPGLAAVALLAIVPTREKKEAMARRLSSPG